MYSRSAESARRKLAGECRACRAPIASATSIYCQQHLDNLKEYMRERHAECVATKTCPDCGTRKRRAAPGKLYCAAHLEIRRLRRRAGPRHGLTQKDREALLEKQGRRCGLCGSKSTGSSRWWHVDHDHAASAEAGRAIVRALLCHQCNTGLGAFRDSPSLLRAAADYVERHRLKRASGS